MKTAVIYARYSSDNQSEQSIEGQLHVCEDYAKNNDIILLDTYIPTNSVRGFPFLHILESAFKLENRMEQYAMRYGGHV